MLLEGELNLRSIISGVTGCVSIACWIIVFTPQLYENWRRKSSDGLSMAFVVIWLLGDIFNVIGAILQKVLPTMIILAVYYTLADIVLFFQCIVYGKGKAVGSDEEAARNEDTPLLGGQKTKQNTTKNVMIVSLVILGGIIGYLFSDKQKGSDPGEPQPISTWGQINGWVCAVLYLASRIPQIKLNYDRKSTDGIALLFFLFAAIGNLTYVISILAADSSPHALLINASWLVGAAGTLILDATIFAQFWVYG